MQDDQPSEDPPPSDRPPSTSSAAVDRLQRKLGAVDAKLEALCEAVAGLASIVGSGGSGTTTSEAALRNIFEQQQEPRGSTNAERRTIKEQGRRTRHASAENTGLGRPTATSAS